jgi:hypothetical protein
MSLKKWISFFGRKRDAAMEWTGASPQRYISALNFRGLYFVEKSSCLIEMVEVGYITFISP